ncbi:chorismate mutase [Kiloniella laminariae]|uniref:chorismate mutase n=1 Tax=Kiloniella laminariae TaxID=454162 RepID=UPI00036D3019|nr:chorismate mutase [Kiloniella laminariae]
MELLAPYRRRIDDLDDQIMELFSQRFQVIREVAQLKSQHGVPAVLQDRVDEVRERNAETGKLKGVDPEFVRRLYTLIINESCELEDRLMGKR